MGDNTFLPDIQEHFYGPAAEAPSAPAAPVNAPDSMQVSWYGRDGVVKKAVDANRPVVKPGAEQKPAVDAKKPGEAPAAKPDAAPAVVPQAYNLKLPDNYAVVDQLMNEFQTWAKARSLTNEQAQEAANLHLKSVAAIEQQRAAAHEDQVYSWHQEIIDAPDIGRANLDSTMAAAKATFSKLILETPGVNAKRLTDDLTKSGLITHPDMIRLFHQVGKMLK
jgi:hypothetical protein